MFEEELTNREAHEFTIRTERFAWKQEGGRYEDVFSPRIQKNEGSSAGDGKDPGTPAGKGKATEGSADENKPQELLPKILRELLELDDSRSPSRKASSAELQAFSKALATKVNIH